MTAAGILIVMPVNHVSRWGLITGFLLFVLLTSCSNPDRREMAEAAASVKAAASVEADDQVQAGPDEQVPTFTLTPTRTPEPTSTPTQAPTLTPKPPPFFDTFVASLINDNPDQVVGVYVEDVLALRVVQQPPSDPGFVSTLPETATYFTMVMQYTGNTGLLAHNYLAGIYFFDLDPGQVVVLIYGDGQIEEYVVAEEQEFQALSPNSPTSSFIDLATGEQLTSNDLFFRVYGGVHRTTFQTCIAEGSIDSWGRLFVISLQD